MKRNVFIAVAFFATLTASAQNIAAVSPSNVTTMYQTLDDAVTKAEDGSIIYLPGGGFQIKDETKITQKLTIMGVSHRADADNVDGATVIAGNLNFDKGSSGSAVVGAYISGNINVGTSTDSVRNLTVRFCNVNSIQVHHSQSSGLIVNQSYLRSSSNFSYCNVRLENNILHSARNISGGTIDHNVITASTYERYYGDYALFSVNNSNITNNIFLTHGVYGSNGTTTNNGASSTVGEVCTTLGETSWDDVFGADNNKGVSINSDYSLKTDWGKNAGTDGKDLGIYGDGFTKEGALAPIPRIVSKEVDEHTNGSGMLQIKVRVKAN